MAQIQQSPEGIPIVQLPRESGQINLPQGLTNEPTVTVVHVPEVERMDTDANTTEIQLESIPSLPDATEDRGNGQFNMDNNSSSEQDEGTGDAYPESTINLQDLR